METKTSFRVVALPAEPFAALFALDDAELCRRGIRRRVADSKPGFPCRVSLADAEPGERLLLLPYKHHDVDSPYQATGPIYVREGVKQAVPAVNEIPEFLRRRLLSVRAYDAAGFMQAAEVTDGRELESHIDRFFADPGVAYLDIHNARPGCFNCRVERV